MQIKSVKIAKIIGFLPGGVEIRAAHAYESKANEKDSTIETRAIVHDPHTGQFTSTGSDSHSILKVLNENKKLNFESHPIPGLGGHKKITEEHEYNDKASEKIHQREQRGDHGHIKDVPLNKIHTTQNHVRSDSVKHFLKGGSSNEPNRQHPRIIKIGQEYHIVDGHHRLIAAALRGDKTIKAQVWD